MAKIQTSVQLDMESGLDKRLTLAGGDFINPTQINVHYTLGGQGYTGTLTGTGLTRDGSILTAGTITGYSQTTDGETPAVTSSITGMVPVSVAALVLAASTEDVKDDLEIAKIALSGADEFTLSPFPDRIYTYEGNDTVYSAGADDTIDGGGGIDYVEYTGASSDHLINITGNQVILFPKAPASPLPGAPSAPAAMTLLGVERLEFYDNKTVALDVFATGNVDDPVSKGLGGNAGKAYRIYQAAFDRAPDDAGVGYWMAVLDSGYSLWNMADGFIGSTEFKSLYGANPTNAQYINALYQNVLNRAADAEGFAYWNAMLTGTNYNGVNYGTTTRQQMLVDFAESPENKDNVAELIGQGVSYIEWTAPIIT